MVLYSATEFIRDELDKYLSSKLSYHPGDNVVTGNASSLSDSTATQLADKVVISLVNIEEERIPKNPENFQKTTNGVVYKNPRVFLNLHLLFVSNKNSYQEALKNLSYIIQFFQSCNVFDGVKHPMIDPSIEKMIFDQVSMNFEQLNHLWAILGSKYIPSVLYKVRMVSVEEGLPEATGEFIKEIHGTMQHKK